MIDLISATTDRTVQAAHDPTWHPKGVRISGRQLAALRPHPTLDAEWNYTFDVQSDLA